MTNRPPYCSRLREYKTPFGAVDDRTELSFRLFLPIDTHPDSVLFLLREDDEQTPRSIPMSRTCETDACVVYECRMVLGEGLYWYRFAYLDFAGTHEVTRFEKGAGYVSGEGKDWQQTVCRQDFTAPDWLCGGIMYQIFPDRFCQDGGMLKSFSDRYYQEDSGAVPSWRQDEEALASGNYLGNDYFGGNLNGITAKLDYLASLGVTCLYLNPIFEAHANHRYNTADYFKIDPTLGTEADFDRLCEKAAELGIRILLDGVFSHTGDDSIYFNRKGRYDSLGAYNSTDSQYYHWYHFEQWPEKYGSWWGVKTLPEVTEDAPDFLDFICGGDGAAKHWLRQGASGWRLDVADELPDDFLEAFRRCVKDQNPNALIIGEVWEDASNKISYGRRRKFLRGQQLDTVMNYPFRDAIIGFLTAGQQMDFLDIVMSVLENYPKSAVDCLMNHIGTHDTPRILTVLGNEPQNGHNRSWQAGRRMDEAQMAKAVRLLKIAAVLQFTLPGVPCIYYGDEAGMEGYGDPFNRAFYPWGHENAELIDFYRQLAVLRHDSKVFAHGELIPLLSDAGRVVYLRAQDDERVLVAVNRWDDPSPVQVEKAWEKAEVLMGSAPLGGLLIIPGRGCCILKLRSL